MSKGGAAALNNVFHKFVSHGAQMLLGMRLAPTEEQHAYVYLSFMQPKHDAVIVDLGCGIGGCGYYLQQMIPTLQIINVVNEPALIAHMNKAGRECVEASFEKTGLPDGVADNVMFNESLGYGDLDEVFSEAARLLKNDGVLTIKDFSPLNQAEKEVKFEQWGYRSRSPEVVIAAAYRHGFHVDVVYHPDTYTEHWKEIMGDETSVNEALGTAVDLFPICQTMYRFVKGQLRGRA